MATKRRTTRLFSWHAGNVIGLLQLLHVLDILRGGQWTDRLSVVSELVAASSSTNCRFASLRCHFVAMSTSGLEEGLVIYVDKVLQCRECAADFVFGAGEQEFYAAKGLVNEPARCPDC